MLEAAIIIWLLSIPALAAWEGFRLDREYRERERNGEFDD
jgi:hypothetical protein